MKNELLKKVLPYAVAVVAFIAISIFYFSPVLDGKTLNQSDIVQYKGSSKEIADYRDKTGQEPLWTNSMFGGMPAYQISTKYDSNFIPVINKIFMLGLPYPANILFLLLISFFLLLVVLRVNPWLALVGAIAFAFSSYFYIAIEVGHNAKTIAVAYMPAVLAGVILIFRGRYLIGGALTALFMALEIAVNHIQMTYYLLIVLGIYGAVEMIRFIIKKQYPAILKSAGVLIIAALLAIGPNVVNLWTSYEYMKDTIRGRSELTSDQSNKSGGLDRDYITAWSYGRGETFTMLIPDAKGGASGRIGENKDAVAKVDSRLRETVAQQNLYWGDMPFTQGTVYVGSFVIFLFVLGMFIVKGRIKWIIFGATVFTIMLAWGHNLKFLTDFFITYIPFYNKFRSVSSILVIAEFMVPLLAILALKEVSDNPGILKDKKEIKRRFMVPLMIAFGLTGGLLLIFLALPKVFFDFTSISEATQFAQYRKQGGGAQIDQIIAGIETARVYIFRMSAWRSLLFIVLGGGLVFMYLYMKKFNKFVFIAAVALVFLLDLVPIAKRYVNNKSFVNPKVAETPIAQTPADAAILKDTTADYRVLNLTVSNFTTDATTSYFHKSIGGYHAAKLKRYQELIEARLMHERDRLVDVLQQEHNDSILIATMYGLTSLNMLNTKYYIYNPEAPPLKNPAALGNAWFVKNVKIVDNADEEIKAVTNFIPATTAIVDKRFEDQLTSFKGDKDPNSSISLIDYKPNLLTYEAKGLKTPQLAVFSEIYYDKGWDAYVNGEKMPYFRANYALRGMIIPAGDSKIEFRFEPESFITGSKVSLAGSLLIILVLLGAIGWEIKVNYFTKKAEQ